MKDQFRAELSDRLRLPQSEIMTRPEVAAEFGVHEKTISNGGKRWPGFFLAPIGRHGWALYRRDWIVGYRLGQKVPEGRQPWPPAQTSADDIDFMLDDLKITDAAYRSELHGDDPASET